MSPPRTADFELADTDELLRMWRASFEFGVGIVDPHPIDEQRRYLLDELRPKYRIQVVKRGDHILGFLAAHGSYVGQLYVRVDHLGQGIGSGLIQLAKEQSGGTLHLHTFTRNARARRFYERHGFSAIEFGFEPMWQLDDVKYEWRRERHAG